MEYIKLSEAADIITGFPFKSEKFNINGDGIKLVRGKNIGKGFLHWGEDARYWNEEFSEIEKYSLKLDDIIIGMDGSNVGKNFAVVTKKDLPSLLVQRVARVRAKQGFDQNYLKYCIINNKFTNYVNDVKTGSAIPHISGTQINNYMIPKYDYYMQRKIGKVIDSITKKIEANNEINNNLHELNNNMYVEFLSQLDNSNSSNKQIKEVSKCVLGGTPSRAKSEYWNGNVNWINSGEVNKFRIIDASEKITDLGLQKSSTVLLPKETTVLAITGATLGQVSRLEIDSCANQSVIGIIPNNNEMNNYIYLSILNTINDLKLKQTGGAQQHINKNDVETHEIVIPNDKLLKEFDERVTPIFSKISLTCFENKKLEELRDVLLPKLMNGEIDLDNIEI